MKIVGHFEDGKVVFDVPPPYADGTPANVQVQLPPRIPGQPRDESHEQWFARLKAFCESHPFRQIEIDDNRDSLYDRNSE